MANPWHFINCHGAPAYTDFLGDPDAPVSHRASRLVGRVVPGTVVAAECCYGAELFDPALTDGRDGIGITYLREGAAGCFGSTNIAYGPADFPAYADVLCAQFLLRVRAGASIGRACAEARQAYVTATPILGPTDLKTLGQFILLGDPTRTPAPAASGHGARESSSWAARRVRRLSILGNGADLGKWTAHVVQSTGQSPHSPPPGAIAAMQRAWRVDPSDTLAFGVVTPSAATRLRPEPALAVHVLLRRDEGPLGRLPRIVNVAVTTRGDEVISTIEAESR